MTRTRITTLAALLLAALFLTGCGGSGGGEPTVTQTLHDELQAELDAALADLEKERKAKADEEAARETAEGEVTRLRGELETATDNVTRLDGELATATTGVGRLTAQLTTANNNVESLTDRIGTADDADSLQGMLAAEKARVTTLMNQIGTAPGGDDTGGSGLRKDLADAEANVARLTAQIGTAEDADSLQGMLKAEKDEVTRLTTLIGAEANEADADGSLYAQLKYAKAEVMRLTGEIGTASDSDSLKGMLEAAKLEVIRLKSRVTTLNERITGLQSQLADASTDVADAEREAEQAKREADQRVAEAEQQAETQADVSARVGPLLMALVMEEIPPGNDQVPRPSYKRGGKLKFEPTGGYTRGSNAPSISGWTSYSFSDLRGTLGTDTFYLYTNIKTAGTKAFWKLYGPSIVNVAGDAKAKPNSFGSDRSLYRDNEGGSEPKDDASHGGTYDGVRGTFKCAIGCNMTADTGGVITIPAGWSFKPTGRPTSGVNLGHDSEYLYFGIWAFAPKEAGSTTAASPEFKWIAGGGAADGDCATDATCAAALDDIHLTALKDTGRFTGGAVGRYAVKAQLGQNAKIGTFTADATFTANFGTESAIGTIKGRIVNFRENGQSLANWNVVLGSGPGAATAVNLDTGTAMSGDTSASIGGLTADGKWAAYLHGSNNPGYNDFDADDICPVSAGCLSADLAGLVGWFNASTPGDTDTAALAGAFGAEYKP